MTVDAAGNVWSAEWNGSRVTCYRPDGAVAREIALPTPRITSVAFGGPDFADLYVTTRHARRRPGDGHRRRAVVSPSARGLRPRRVSLPHRLALKIVRLTNGPR